MIGASSQSTDTPSQHSTLGTLSQHHNQHHQQQHHHQHLVNHRTSSVNQQHNADDDYQDDHGMRVGNNYQAEVPQFIAYAPAPEYYEEEKAIRVWSPYNKIPDHVLDEFITKAKEKFFYNTEQALGMLSWHKFDLNRAYADLPNFVPYPNEWSVEDKVLFEQAYQFHEKQFHKIKQMLPDKSMANLINYYYSWKKTRTRASLMERQTRRFAARKAAGSNGPSDEEDEADEENEASNIKADIRESEDPNGITDNKMEEEKEDEIDIQCCICQGCLKNNRILEGVIIEGPGDNFCTKCFLPWKSSGKKINQASQDGDCFYQLSGEPRRLLLSHDDVLALVDGIPEAGDLMLKQLDVVIQDYKRDIQTKKQTLSQINEKIRPIANQIEDLNMNEFSRILPDYEPSERWTPEEMQLVVQSLRRYGADFSAISDVVRTKSPEQVKLLYVSQKDRLGLHLLVSEFERNKESSSLPPQEQTETPQQTTRTTTDEQLRPNPVE